MPVVESALLVDGSAFQRFRNGQVPAAAGALVSFAGVVRELDQDRLVVELEYVAHPSAERVLEEIAAQVAGRHPAVATVRVAHRVGRLRVGDHALIAEVSSAHRAEAFAGCCDLVESVKALLPVWKRQTFADGTDEWVNCP